MRETITKKNVKTYIDIIVGLQIEPMKKWIYTALLNHRDEIF